MTGTTRDIVMLVDDSPETLTVLTEALEEAGTTVLVARDGATALDLAGRVEPDLVLLDALMPGLDGFETCRRLKARPALALTPVIFMTGLSDTRSIVRGLEAGGVDYVTKPVDASVLIARIAVHVANARILSESQSALDAAGRSVLAIDRDGAVQWASPRARALLDLPDGDLAGSLAAPERAALAAWLAESRGRPVSDIAPVEITGRGGPVTLGYIGRTPNGTALIRVWQVSSVPTAERLARRFALTPREAEVLARLADGKSNRDISDILSVSHRTVTKHLEQIYTKLGVENRTSAAILALKASTEAED